MATAGVVVDLGAGRAVVGDRVIEVAPVDGGLATGQVVLRALTFGERTRVVADAPAGTLAGAVLATARVRGVLPAGPSLVALEALALHLAGARPDDEPLSFAEAAAAVASAYGWSAADITSADADMIDRLARAVRPTHQDDGWTNIAFAASSTGEDAASVRDRLVEDLLRRAPLLAPPQQEGIDGSAGDARWGSEAAAGTGPGTTEGDPGHVATPAASSDAAARHEASGRSGAGIAGPAGDPAGWQGEPAGSRAGGAQEWLGHPPGRAAAPGSAGRSGATVGRSDAGTGEPAHRRRDLTGSGVPEAVGSAAAPAGLAERPGVGAAGDVAGARVDPVVLSGAPGASGQSLSGAAGRAGAAGRGSEAATRTGGRSAEVRRHATGRAEDPAGLDAARSGSGAAAAVDHVAGRAAAPGTGGEWLSGRAGAADLSTFRRVREAVESLGGTGGRANAPKDVAGSVAEVGMPASPMPGGAGVPGNGSSGVEGEWRGADITGGSAGLRYGNARPGAEVPADDGASAGHTSARSRWLPGGSSSAVDAALWGDRSRDFGVSAGIAAFWAGSDGPPQAVHALGGLATVPHHASRPTAGESMVDIADELAAALQDEADLRGVMRS